MVETIKEWALLHKDFVINGAIVAAFLLGICFEWLIFVMASAGPMKVKWAAAVQKIARSMTFFKWDQGSGDYSQGSQQDK